MNALVVPVLLFVTVAASVGFGVLAAYAVVFAILNSFGRPAAPQLQPQVVAKRPRLVLVPTQNQVGGD